MTDDTMTDDTMALAERFTDALHALDKDADALDDMVALFAEDATLENAALDLEGETREGTDGARAFWDTYRKQFARAETTFHHVTAGDGGEAGGPAAGLFWTTRGESPDGQSLDYHGATLLAFDGDGKVKRFRGYYDTRQLEMEKPAG